MSMKNFLRTLLLLLAGSFLAACTTFGTGNGSLKNTGSSAIGAGTVAELSPGALGDEILGDLSSSARSMALQNELIVLNKGPAGVEHKWTSPDGYSGTIRPAQPFKIGSRVCRQYSHEVSGAGLLEARKATACKHIQGSWSVVK